MPDVNIQTILDGLATGSDLSALLAGADVAAVEQEATARYLELADKAAEDDEALEAATVLGTVLDGLGAVKEQQAASKAERDAKVEALRSRIAQPTTETAPAEEAAPAEAAPVEAPQAIAAAPAAPTAAHVTVTPRTVNLAAIAAQQPSPAPVAPKRGYAEYVIAASDIPGIAGGNGFPDRETFARSIADKLGTKPTNKVHLATIRKPFADDLRIIASKSGQSHNSILDHATDESRLEGGSLLAAGGWCAPSETWYDICPSNIYTNLFDLPSVGIDRGGVRYTKGLSLGAIYTSGVGFNYTETELEAGVTKPCHMVSCPDFLEQRLEANGVCVKTDIPMNRAYPELIAEFNDVVLALHALTVQQSMYADVLAGSGSVGSIGSNAPGATVSILDASDLVAHNVRSAHLRSWMETVEIWYPAWVKGMIRTDLAKRNGYPDSPFAISDSMISSWFAARNVMVRWLSATYGGGTAAIFLDPAEGDDANPPDLTGWPTTVQGIAYLPGTWVAVEEDIITMRGVYDSVGLESNVFTSLFTESALSVVNKCYNSYAFTIPVCPSGASAVSIDLDCS